MLTPEMTETAARTQLTPESWIDADTALLVDSGIDADHPALGGMVNEAAGVEVTRDESGEIVVQTSF